MKRTSMNRVSSKRRKQRAQYTQQAEAYLIAHPFDQIWIARNGLEEALVIEVSGYIIVAGRLCHCPRSDQVHHRNKRDGERLTDERWWMATAGESHELVEQHKDWAREEGYLLPIQSDADGKWGDGNQALTTQELMEAKRHERTA